MSDNEAEALETGVEHAGIAVKVDAPSSPAREEVVELEEGASNFDLGGFGLASGELDLDQDQSESVPNENEVNVYRSVGVDKGCLRMEEGHCGEMTESSEICENGYDGCSDDHCDNTKKRNSAEIRNNIPDVNEIKNYDNDGVLDVAKYSNSNVAPRIIKKSPGVARRLADGVLVSERDTSSSEKEVDPPEIDTTVISAQKDFETQLRSGNPVSYTAHSRPQVGIQDTPVIDGVVDGSVNQIIREIDKDLIEHKGQGSRNRDVENEYDYVKYARIQHGDSYVGMRLAYSSSNDSLNLRQNWNRMKSSDDEPYFGSSREGSPEKVVPRTPRSSITDPIRVSKVSEDTLTEIPLNGTELTPSEEARNFSLSPEQTDCDSAEVESVLSDEGKSSTSGMPMVEDGLSSSQASDTEDTSSHDAQQPAEILKRRHKSDLEQDLLNKLNVMGEEQASPSVTDDSSVYSTPSCEEVNSLKKDALDLAMKDIRTAIRRSKDVSALKEGYDEDGSGPDHEPVWIMRDTYARKFHRQEDIKRVRETIDRNQEDELLRKEQEKVYEIEVDDENLLKYQYTRNDGKIYPEARDFDTDEETDELLDKEYQLDENVDIPELSRPPVNRSAQAEKRRSRVREVALRDPNNETVLIEGVLFRSRYLGSTQLINDAQPSKATRMIQAQEAVGRIKAPEGENQPSTDVDIFISTEKIMILNTDLQEIMMDHALRTISYIADIGDVLVIMAKRGPVTTPGSEGIPMRMRQTKVCCHVFESDEAQLIAQSIGQAFQVAYMEFLKANGIEDPGLMKELDYQEVLNQQEIYGEELYLFSNKESQKEVIVPKLRGEPLGVVVVESGWGSMVPTVVLANMSPTGSAARCGQLNIGDQIMSINGVSLVGLPLSSCQNYIKVAKNQTVVKLTVVSCPPVVEVVIKRPDVKYQLGFSVQNGVICSLLRGGIAERGGVRVGHRIIEINSQSVVAVPHEKIVNMLATSVGEIKMKTMPTSIFRLLTGQDTPHYI